MIVVRSGKGDKDRVVMLPRLLSSLCRTARPGPFAMGGGPSGTTQRRVHAACT